MNSIILVLEHTQ